MTQQQHPITPPLELVQQLYGLPQMRAIGKAFEAGADQEREEICKWLEDLGWYGAVQDIRAAHIYRRPKEPNLKEKALEELAWVDKNLKGNFVQRCNAIHTIRQALESILDPS